jgi:type I restriction enzyme S subunit
MKKTSLGLIPRDWKVVRLDTVAKRGSGHTPDKEHPEYWGGPIKWISLADSDRLDQVYISETAQTITPAGIAHSSAVVHPSGTVVLSRDAGIGKSAIMTEDMAVSQHFMAWRCGPDLENLFLYYWLQSKKSEFERIAAGNTIKTIGLPYFRQLEIPLPPLEEQRAISAALLDMDESLKAQDTLIAKKRAIRYGTMQVLLRPNETWAAKALGQLANIQRGASPRPIDSPIWFDENSCIGWVRISDVTRSGMYLKETTQRLSDAGVANSRKVPRGSLIMSICATVGRPIITDIDVCIHDGFVVFNDLDVDKRFLYYVLRSLEPSWSKQGQTGSQMNLNTTLINRTTISVPAHEEQLRISTILYDMDSEIVALEQRCEKTRAIKWGIMQELLTGRTRLV